MTSAPQLKWTRRESDLAHEEWKANCGPHALAAALGQSLDTVRDFIPNFRGWMNPTMVGETLRNMGAQFALVKGLETTELCDGINRLQWEGPWLNAGVPARVAYHHTHWIAHFDGWVLCAAVNPAEWLPVRVWGAELVRRAMPWHVTHHYQFPLPEASPS